MGGWFKQLGITRVASVTALDRIGIPVYLATRPNSCTLAVTQGKGIDDDSARASAIMEAAEQAIAERPRVSVVTTSTHDLAGSGESFVRPARFLRRGAGAPGERENLDWIEGYDLLEEETCWVPLDAVALDFTRWRKHPFWQSSDGLASGNVLLEAVVHGLCERVERDASALWSFCRQVQILARCVDTEEFEDGMLSALASQVSTAGLVLRMFDITSDIGIPTYFAVISENRPEGEVWRHFDMSRGTGCHPVGARAAIRAVTEAAQSRLTAISGARDDFLPEMYVAHLRPDLHVFRNAKTGARKPTLGRRDRNKPGDHLAFMLGQLKGRGIRSAVIVPLGGEGMGFSVAKVVVPDLEDPPESRHRRFGRRALNAMLGA